MTRVGVLGARGRMGAEVCAAVEADAELDLAAAIGRGDDLGLLVDRGVEVAVDFTTPDSVVGNVRFCLSRGIHAVVGTSGIGDADLHELGGLAQEHGANLFMAPNFAVGAVLMMRFAAQAAALFRAAEIIERHHDKKLDAPSGTALRTARLMNAARTEPWDRAPETAATRGSRGSDVAGVSIHSLRLPGSVAHQEVILGSPGETLTIRHDSLDRASFMPGVVLAIKKVASLPGVTVGLEHLLDV